MIAKRKYFGTKNKPDLTDQERATLKEYKDRFLRWQTKQIDLLSFFINLIFTLTIAVTGFIISNQEKDFFKNKFICGKYSLTHTSLLILAISASIGLVALISRLIDFRLTKDTVKARRRIFELRNDIKYEDYEPSDIDYQKTKRDRLVYWTRFLGISTWLFFIFQLLLFVITMWIIVLNV